MHTFNLVFKGPARLTHNHHHLSSLSSPNRVIMSNDAEDDVSETGAKSLTNSINSIRDDHHAAEDEHATDDEKATVHKNGVPSPVTPNKKASSSNSKSPSGRPKIGTPGRSPKASASGKSSTSGDGRKKTSKRPTKKKGISFKKTVGVHTIPNLDTYSQVEKELTWYAPDDYGQMEDECDLTADLLDRRKPLWPGQCPRGLEAWTTEGEQRKEGHVQLAIDIVWQAQLEQWKASSDIHECWEFIRSRYLAVSAPCHKMAHKRGLNDEQEVQPYLSGVRSVERNRQRLLGIHQRSTTQGARRIRPDAETPRSSTSKKKIGRTMSEVVNPGGDTKSPPGRHHSTDNIKVPKKGLLKTTILEDEEAIMVPGAKVSRHSNKDRKDTASTDDDVSEAPSGASGRKISYQPKSRSKVPVSPVASLCTEADSDEGSTTRRLRSHMSVSSDDSTRRRMLRTTSMKPPL